ncbi:MAG: hypothetical protein ACJ780_17575 [Solirubrobacteraceae bacterium]
MRSCKGMVSHAAERLGVTQQAVSYRLGKHPSLRAVVAESREGMKDLAELRLFEKLDAGEPWAIQFYLKTMGRDRGYVEKREHEHGGAGGGPLRIIFETVDDRRGADDD